MDGIYLHRNWDRAFERVAILVASQIMRTDTARFQTPQRGMKEERLYDQEDGVSGHKVRMETGTSCKISKEYTKRSKFDILPVLPFDHIGRIADEPPFVECL